jgi:bifunctional non-homologous end joining protein LigD
MTERKPMLATALEGRFEDYCRPEWVLEEKFDGNRVLVRVTSTEVVAWSRPRGGKPALRKSLPTRLVGALRGLPPGLYDGELVAASGRSWDVGRLDQRETLQIVCFDVLELLDVDLTRETHTSRHSFLTQAVAHLPADDRTRVRLVEVQPVSRAAVEAIWARGGEGAILKRSASTYQPGKRSHDWIKVKRQSAATVTIRGFKAGKTGPFSIACVQSDDGAETTVRGRDMATIRAIEQNPQAWIGRRLVISFHERTPDGSFRHPVWDHLAGQGD